jgi:hypothetical protein
MGLNRVWANRRIPSRGVDWNEVDRLSPATTKWHAVFGFLRRVAIVVAMKKNLHFTRELSII